MIAGPFGCIPRHVAADPRVRGSLGVLIVIASYDRGTGVVWPSTRDIAADAGVQLRTARWHIEKLIDAGALIRERDGGGRQRAAYRLPWVIHKSAATPRTTNGDGANESAATPRPGRGHTAPRARRPDPVTWDNAPALESTQESTQETDDYSYARDTHDARVPIVRIDQLLAAGIADGQASRAHSVTPTP